MTCQTGVAWGVMAARKPDLPLSNKAAKHIDLLHEKK